MYLSSCLIIVIKCQQRADVLDSFGCIVLFDLW